ncbi:MAG: IS21 family transposase [Actinobacteria bacterium]|nr:IS21 family transposase [Actinomycetota bacterium]
MKKKRISMDKIREILRLSQELNLGCRKIAQALSISKTAVSQYVSEFRACGIDYQGICNLTDSKLSELLSTKKKKSKKYEVLESYFCYFAKELKRKGVTLKTLWEEYIADNPNGYSYARTTWHYRVWKQASQSTMHIEHKAGDKMFVDFAGQKLQIVDRKTGEIKDVEVFVAILGASQLTYVEAVETQKSSDWIRANENAFLKFGGVTSAIVPDNLKSAVTNPNKYEPDINPEYEDFARHYGTVILPARSGKQKDKALAECAVKIVYQRIFAPLRDRIFYSTLELNEEIADLTDRHNSIPFQKLKISRYGLFLEVEKDSLKPLPAERYEFKKFAYLKVTFNYHIELAEDRHYYSVPYNYIRKKVKVIYTEKSVEIYHNNIRIAFHARDRKAGGYTTIKDHMPSAHKFYAEWSPERITGWAAKIGDDVKEMTVKLLKSRDHPEQAYRSSIGIISLAKKYGNGRVNKACARALSYKLYKYKAVKNILEKGLDRIEEEPEEAQLLPIHSNIRGADYYK